MQRHHLLPRQLMIQRSLAPMLDMVGRDRVGFADFRRNGVLLPANEEAAARVGLPLHRGPHRRYNAMVAERIGQIEAGWAVRRCQSPVSALDEASMRLRLLQMALRRRLLRPGTKPILLNRNDPLGRRVDFSELDAMVDELWAGTDLPIFGAIS
jgi:A nuclease family of the HNH/ENDO VII superfamily with conserved AHH